MPGAGKRQHKLTIQQNTPTRSTSGADVDSWGTYKTVWANLEPARAAERTASRTPHADADYFAEFPYLDAPAVTGAMRVTYGSRTFDILGAQPDNRTRYVVLSLKERRV